jgi:transcriptional regulator with XRE-family HTH domain
MSEEYNENIPPAENPNEADLFGQDETFNVPPPPPAALMPDKEKANVPPPPVASTTTAQPKVQMFVDGEQKRFAQRAEEAETPAAAPKHTPAKIHLNPADFSADVKYGDLLRYARQKSGYTVEQIADRTKLRTYYLYAMEDGQTDRLPPPTYVSSYLRSLCVFYRLDDASVDFLRQRFNKESASGDSSIPPALIETMEKDVQVSEAEEQRIKKMFRLFAVVLLLIILLIAWAVYAIVCPDHSAITGNPTDAGALSEPGARPEMTLEEFDSLTAPQMPDISTLEMNKKPTVNRSGGR